MIVSLLQRSKPKVWRLDAGDGQLLRIEWHRAFGLLMFPKHGPKIELDSWRVGWRGKNVWDSIRTNSIHNIASSNTVSKSFRCFRCQNLASTTPSFLTCFENPFTWMLDLDLELDSNFSIMLNQTGIQLPGLDSNLKAGVFTFRSSKHS